MIRFPHRLAFLALAVLVVVCLLVPFPARCGGFSTPIIGSRMIGRLSFVAVADDTSAIFHNPAGLAQIDGYRIDVSAIGLYSHTLYRIEQEDGTLTAPIESEHPYGVLPFAGFSGDFGNDRLHFGLGIYSPHNIGSSLPPDSPARFQLIEGRIVTLFLTPTVAYEVNDKLSIGFGFSLVDADAHLKRWADFEQSHGIPVTAIVDIKAHDLGYGWDAGLIYKPTTKLSFGLSYHSPTKLSFEGDLDASNPELDLTGGADVTAAFTLPQDVRLGVDYRFSDRFDLGFDVYWQDYSVYEDLTIKLTKTHANIGGAELELGNASFVEKKNAHDIVGLALGGTYRVSPRWDLSAGYLYDPSPYPDSTYGILSPDANKHGVALGVGYTRNGLTLHTSLLRLFYKDRIIDNSVLQPKANGNVKGKFNNGVALQVSYAF